MTGFVAFLKAVPKLVSVIESLKQSIIYLADNRTDAKIAEIKEELRHATETFETTNDREKMLEIVRNLNTKLSS